MLTSAASPDLTYGSQELRAAFDAESLLINRPALLLTVAVPAGVETIEKGFNVPRLNA